MKKALLIKNAIFYCIFLCVSAVFLMIASPSPAEAADAPNALQPQIFYASGVVEIRQKDASAWERVKKGGLVPPGASIATEPDAGAILSIGGGVLHIFGETELVFEELPAQTSAKSSTTITLGVGRIFLSVPQLPTADSAFTIKTPSAAAAVRGSAEFLVKLADDNKTTLSTASGQITAGSQGVEIVLDPGYTTTIEPGMPPAEIYTILPLDMAELETESRTANAITVASAQNAPQLSSSAASGTGFQPVKTSTATPASATTQTTATASSSATTATSTTTTTTATPTRTMESLITEAEQTAPKQKNKPAKPQAKSDEPAKTDTPNGNAPIDTAETNKDKKAEDKKTEIKPTEKTPAQKTNPKTPPSDKTKTEGQTSSPSNNKTTPPPTAKPTPAPPAQTDEEKLQEEIERHLNELLNDH